MTWTEDWTNDSSRLSQVLPSDNTNWKQISFGFYKNTMICSQL